MAVTEQLGQERGRALAPGFVLVVVGAALWGTDALFRRGLALSLPAAAVVLGEHAILVAITLPWLYRGLRAARRLFGWRDWVALAVVGAGASAGATVAFTAALAAGDPTTPLLLQKLQPLFAMAGARLLLGERLTPRYGLYAVTALAAAWLVGFPDPLRVSLTAGRGALLAVLAAAL
jgi:DME family drug/metabolite transporter